jgi:hypothetical protein
MLRKKIKKMLFNLFDKVAQFVYKIREDYLLTANEWLDDRASRYSDEN